MFRLLNVADSVPIRSVCFHFIVLDEIELKNKTLYLTFGIVCDFIASNIRHINQIFYVSENANNKCLSWSL